MARIETEWTLQATEEGDAYGALYEAADEADAREWAKDFLTRQKTRYSEVTIYRHGQTVCTLTPADVAPKQTQTPTTDQTTPNLVWVFAESEAVPSCQKTGRRLEFMAPTVADAAKSLEYYLGLSDGRARLGKSGLVAYPTGIDGAFCWVFDAQETARAQGDTIPGAEVNL
jgi:hypothetical protein